MRVPPPISSSSLLASCRQAARAHHPHARRQRRRHHRTHARTRVRVPQARRKENARKQPAGITASSRSVRSGRGGGDHREATLGGTLLSLSCRDAAGGTPNGSRRNSVVTNALCSDDSSLSVCNCVSRLWFALRSGTPAASRLQQPCRAAAARAISTHLTSGRRTFARNADEPSLIIQRVRVQRGSQSTRAGSSVESWDDHSLCDFSSRPLSLPPPCSPQPLSWCCRLRRPSGMFVRVR